MATGVNIDSSDDDLFDIDALDYLYKTKRQIRQRREPFHEYSEKKFHARFRVTKTTALKILENVEDKLKYTSNRNSSLSPINQLLLTLRFYATSSFHLLIGDTFGVDKSTACRTIHKVSRELARLMPKFVKFPTEQAAVATTMKEFYDYARFPGVLGAIDGIHVPIQSNGGNMDEVYRNRKGYFSINVQYICNANLCATDVVARWPGSTNDTTIFDSCAKKAIFEKDPRPEGYLIGDGGYRCRKYLLTPLVNPKSPGERAYNKAHIAVWNPIKRFQTIIKQRFPALKLGLRVKLNKIPAIIIACTTLHNIARLHGDDDPPDDLQLEEYLDAQRSAGVQVDFDEVSDYLPPDAQHQPSATGVRTEVINKYFSFT